MSDLSIIRRGGGGASLNYKIIGGTSRPGGGDTLTWDGNTEGLVSVLLPNGVELFRISDAVPTRADCENGVTVVYSDGSTETLTNCFDVNDLGMLGSIVSVPKDNFNWNGVIFPKAGCWAMNMGGRYVASLTIPNYTGFGGGGSVKDNTIWVDTETEITSHVFSATEPTSPVPGMVWFQTGMSSNAAFNALKKNSIEVYPTGCKQYVVDAWVAKTAETYMNGKWVDWWNGELYDSGNEYSAQTGGWEIVGTGSKESNYIRVGATSAISPSTNSAQFNNCVDLSAYSTLKLNFIELSSNSTTGRIHVYLYNVDGEKLASETILSGNKSELNVIKSVDISSVEEPISVQVVTYHQNEKRIVYADFNQVWAE